MNLDFSSAFADAGSSMDLAGAIDLSQISLNFDGLPQLDLGQILSGLTLNVSEDGMQELASSLMEGYQGYASEHPEADYSHLQEDFVSYINSTEAQEKAPESAESSNWKAFCSLSSSTVIKESISRPLF